MFASTERIHQAHIEAGRIEGSLAEECRLEVQHQRVPVLCWVEEIATYGLDEDGCVGEPRVAQCIQDRRSDL